jgi:hypothetical protein
LVCPGSKTEQPFITPQSTVLEKLIKKLSAFHGTWRFFFCKHSNPQLDHILRQVNPLIFLVSCLEKIQFNIILPSTIGLPSGLPFRFLDKKYFNAFVTSIWVRNLVSHIKRRA